MCVIFCFAFVRVIESFLRLAISPMPMVGNDALLTIVDGLEGFLFYRMAAPWTVERLIEFMLTQAKFGGAEGKRIGAQAGA